MKLVSRLLTIVLSLTLLAGIGLAAYLIWINNPLAPPPTAPVVEVRSVELGAVVTVAVNVQGTHVTRAELWSDTQLLARETNPNPTLTGPWMVAWQWAPPGPGVYPLAARAFDDANRYGGSSLFDIVVPPHEQLIFSSNRDSQPGSTPGASGYALYTLDPITRETVRFNPSPNEERQPNVSRAGIAAFAEKRAGAWHIVTRAANAAEPIDLTPDLISAQRPVWSADGQHLAFEVTTGGATNVIVSDARGQSRLQVTQGDSYEGQASFSPDGKHLAFAGQLGGQWDIYTVGVDGKNLTRLTSNPAQDWQPVWSPDGGRIAFASNRSGVSQLYVMSATGNGEAVQLTNLPSGAEQPAWSSDGNWLAFVAYTGDAQENNRRELYLLYVPKDQPPVEGRGLVRLTQNAFDDTEPTWMGTGG